MEGPDENSSSRFVRDFVRAYNREISENNLMATELYVSLVSHKATLLKRDKYKESEIREELNERLDVFGKVFDQLVSSLRDYEPAVLGEYEVPNTLRQKERFSMRGAATHKVMLGIEKAKIKQFQADLLRHFDSDYPEIGQEIEEKNLAASKFG